MLPIGINLNSQNREIMHSQLEKCVTTEELSRFHEMDDNLFLYKKFVQHGFDLNNHRAGSQLKTNLQLPVTVSIF